LGRSSSKSDRSKLLYWLQAALPAGYRAYIGTTPTFAIGAPVDERPDVVVRNWSEGNGSQTPAPEPSTIAPADPQEEPDQEIAVATLGGEKALFVEYQGRLIACH